MAGADKIIARILDEARQKAGQNLENAEAERRMILNTANEKAEQKKQEILEKAKKDILGKEMRMAPYIQLEAKKEKLRAKQEIIDETFERAVNKLCSLPLEQYLDTLVNMVLCTAEDGTGEIILSGEDKGRIGDALIERVNNSLKSGGNKAGIRLSPVTGRIKGGFILKRGDIEINNSFEAITMSKRDTLESEVVNLLFGEGT